VTMLESFVGKTSFAFATVRTKSKTRGICHGICLLLLCVVPIKLSAQMISAPSPQTGTITGTVEDLNGGLIPGATVAIEEISPDDHRRVSTDGEGFFSLGDVPSALTVHLLVHADGFQDWTSAPVTLTPGQMYDLVDIRLSLSAVETTVNAIMPE